jgi:glutamate-1-semialdehyde 2,1-aminomutase
MENSRYSQSAALLERSKKVLAGGVASEFRKYNHPHAIFYAGGKGSRITDVDGNEYLDFTLSQGPLILGHSHPHVLESVREYSEQGQLYAGQHIREIELAEKLNEHIPSAELMRFCLDGSEAVQTAFRVARAKRAKINSSVLKDTTTDGSTTSPGASQPPLKRRSVREKTLRLSLGARVWPQRPATNL